MSYRPRVVLALSLLILLSLTLSACNRERPAPTTTTTTPAATRGPWPHRAQRVEARRLGLRRLRRDREARTRRHAQRAVSSAGGRSPVCDRGARRHAGQGFTYTVVAGDTLLTIATRFGTTTEAIAQLNSLADPNALTLGQKLQIPGSGFGRAAASQGRVRGTSGGSTGAAPAAGGNDGWRHLTYTVQQGDTLGAIAKRSARRSRRSSHQRPGECRQHQRSVRS